MEPLFSIESKYTEEEFVKFNRYMIFHNKHYYVKCGVMIVIMCVLLSKITRLSDTFSLGTAIAVFTVWLLLLVWGYTWGADRKARKYYAKDKVINSLEYKLSFFEDHLEQTQSNGSASLEYDKIHKIYLSKNNVYIMRSPSVGFIIQRRECPAGLIDLILKIKHDYNI